MFYIFLSVAVAKDSMRQSNTLIYTIAIPGGLLFFVVVVTSAFRRHKGIRYFPLKQSPIHYSYLSELFLKLHKNFLLPTKVMQSAM